MNNENDILFAFCWFDNEQWDLLAEIDPDGVDDSYKTWRKSAIKSFQELENNGKNIQKVNINISELKLWCKNKNKEPNSKSRSEYAAYMLQSRNKKHNK